jgi:replicative DNA helicase
MKLDTFISFEAALTDAINETNDAPSFEARLSGLSTGLRDLDQVLGGLHPAELIVIGGRPSNGKTALATNIAYNVAKGLPAADKTARNSGAVAYFSLETVGPDSVVF